MAGVTVKIHGRDYRVACDDGQEDHVKKLARELDERVSGLAKQAGAVQETQLLVLTSLILTDELQDTRIELTKLRCQMENTSQSHERNKMVEMEKILSNTINEIAGRIEKIAGQIE
jgi:cell division protein ZapA